MSVDDLFGGGQADDIDLDLLVAATLRPIDRWRRAASALNYVGFVGGLGMVLIRDMGDLVPEGISTPLVVGAILASVLSVPGAFVSIWAWIRAEETLRMARSGALPDAVGGPAHIARQRAFVVLGVAALCLVVQLWALSQLVGGAAPEG
jgi:hypothetical protein